MADAALLAAGVVTAPTMPETLGAARGKIVLLRRYKDSTLGVDLYEHFPKNNTLPQLDHTIKPPQRFYIQDVCEPENYGLSKNADRETAIATKKQVVDAALSAAASDTGGPIPKFYFNFASAVYFLIRSIQPDTVIVSKPVNEHVVNYLKDHPRAKTGFLIMDWMTADTAHLILYRNMVLTS